MDRNLNLQLLSTKLFFPPLRPTLVPRPHLVAHLNHGLNYPLTLISAPAGFGKTTLISEWRASTTGSSTPFACLALENDDNDPIRFLTYLVAALGTLMPDLVESALVALQSPQPPPLRPFLSGLINDLDRFTSPFVLVLDDYHVITAQPVHEAITFILDHLPRQMHLILLTRADPPLPLARLRARDQLVELRADDLRFTVEETTTFLNQVMGLALSDVDINTLEHRTEGWVTALQLAALSLHGYAEPSRLITTFGGGYHYIVDYLVEEVLNLQSDPLREFLLQTSILERMTGALCDALTGGADGQTTLEYLETANLFVTPIDNECCWYRYHHLFADVLRNRLQLTHPDQLHHLHIRASEWYEQNGFVSEAIHHALSARDQPRAAHLIERNALAMLMRGDAVSVLNWIASIAPLVPNHPWLSIFQSWAYICTGQLAHIEASLHRAEERITSHVSGTEADQMRNHMTAIRALVAARRGEAQRAIDLAQNALECLPESDATIRSIVIFTLGDAYWQTGDLTGAKRSFAEVNKIDKAAGNFLAGVLALASVAVLLTEQGELHRAAETYRTAIQKVTRSDGRMMSAAAQACMGLSSIEYEWNELEAAAQHAQQALELGRRWGFPDELAGTHLMQARLQQAQGDTMRAFECLRQAEELAQEPYMTRRTAHQVDAFRVRLWLAQGNFEAADRWARGQTLDYQDELTYLDQTAYLTLARILVAQNQWDTSLTLLKRLLAQAESLGQMGRVLEVLLLQSLMLEEQGDTPGALSALARALVLGEPEGYIRVFLDEGAPMARLLRHAGSHGVAPKYVARLLSQFDTEIGTSPAAQQPLFEPLTERELQVMRLMAEGLSNQAIANQLVVALGTVKAHTASLYRKLDVTSRLQAVARSRELGLL